MKIHFYKYQGTGNDFVMIDNRNLEFPKSNTALVHHLCDRRFGIGADGLILVENAEHSDFKMVYFNADGTESTMCGNGGRCIVAFAQFLTIIDSETTFEAVDGLHYAKIENDIVHLQMIDVAEVASHETYYFLDTGSPHHIEMVEDVSAIDVKDKGSKIRYGAPYFDEGSNVNFVEQISTNSIKIRTYERGVENETLSCGTGATAAAIASFEAGITNTNTIEVEVEGGMLTIAFTKHDNGYSNIFLIGSAKAVFSGTIDL